MASSNAQFVGAQEPASGLPSPASPMEQQKRFLLPPGFEIELFASEEQGAGKPITVAWDDSGRLWTITALEYPLDGNEQPELAKALYEKGGRDKVLVFDAPYTPGPHNPHVFADGLAMPMGILPYKDGALVGQGPEVYWMHDTDGDGRADKRETILTGFGIQDSHLMPHQFTRAPGGWFYLAQGAFNYSKVKTRDGREHPFNQTRLARFTADGMKFEDVTCGPCNIWGLVIGREGETFIQEANDYGYPVMAYHAGASYPGCSGAFKPYAPYFPSEVDFPMGGTGLSGLALSDPTGSFPGAYADVMYVANPITRKVQAIKIHRNGPWYRYEKLPDFVQCSDEWFRPVAIHFGPDGCLYIVDWYNKIISHNEVPRTHPERDKTRGRIWRVRHTTQKLNSVPDIAKASESDLLKFLGSESTWEMRAAWHQIVDRGLTSLAPDLKMIVENGNASATHRLHAFWTLEDLKQLETKTIRALSADPNRNIRREAVRALATVSPSADETLSLLSQLREDADPEVRAEMIRIAALYAPTNSPAVSFLATMVKPALDQPIGKSPHSGAPMKLREAYDRDFERYLVRATLENLPERAASFLKSDPAGKLPVDTRLLIALALPKNSNPNEVPRLLAQLDRIPSDEELLRLAENFDLPDSKAALKHFLSKETTRRSVLDSLLKVRNRIDASKLQDLLAAPLQSMWDTQPDDRVFVARLGGAFKVESLAPVFVKALQDDNSAAGLKTALLRSLRELNAGDPEIFSKLLANTRDQELRNETLTSLASSKNPAAARWILEYWPEFNALQRRTALRQLTLDATRANALVDATRTGAVQERELDAESVDGIRKLLPNDPDALALVERTSSQFKPVLHLDGRKESFVDSNITLEGPFTVETWVRLEEGISNADGILGYPGGADFNFAGGIFRIYCGPEFGDRAITRRPITPNAWTHFAVSRDSKGMIRVYVNGEIDSTDNRALTATFPDLDIGRTTPGGTAGDLTEFRVWNVARSAEEIRADFDRTFAGEPKPSGLTHYFPGSGPWGTLKGGAEVRKITDAPALLNPEEARAVATRFAKIRALADQEGNTEKGKTLFATACAVCHSVGGQGGQIGPVLNGAAANGIESLLRSVLTPNAAMEAGYRTFRVELKDGDVLDGFLVSQNHDAIVLRQPNVEDQRIERTKVRRADFVQKSIMPEGLLDAMPDQDVRDLIAYLKTLK